MALGKRCALALALLVAALLESVAADGWAFQHGVASGDPLPTQIILWTRVTWTGSEAAKPSSAVLDAEVSKNPQFNGASVRSYKVTCASSADYTCKLDADGLQPGVRYHFRFTAPGSATSPVGRFKLPYPKGDARQGTVRLAVFSCSNWGWGYFHAYAAAAKYALDFWVHVGDFIYEKGLDSYPVGNATNPAVNQAVRLDLNPPWTATTLSDYRMRYAQYRTDAALQALSAAAPLLAIWDDHESADNAFKDGFPPNPQQPSDAQRRDEAEQAWHEWMPIRSLGRDGVFVGLNINRTLHWGDTVSVLLTEDRLTARSAPPTYNGRSFSTTQALGAAVAGTDPSKWGAAEIAKIQAVKALAESFANDPSRTILGASQMAWLREETLASVAAGVNWQLYAVTTVLQDWTPDPVAAIAALNNTDPTTAAVWASAWANCSSSDVAVVGGRVTNKNAIKTYDRTCFRRPIAGASIPFNLADPTSLSNFQQVVGSCRVYDAVRQFKVHPTDFDSWQGFRVERDALLDIADLANNAGFIAGDSHNSWAGVLTNKAGKVVASEFDVASVTSPGWEYIGFFLPPALLSSTFMAGGGLRSGIRHINMSDKGFAYVTFNTTKQHVDFVSIGDHCTPAGINSSYCSIAFDRYSASERAKGGLENDIVRAACLSEDERINGGGDDGQDTTPSWKEAGCSSYNGAKPTVYAFPKGTTKLLAVAPAGRTWTVDECAKVAKEQGALLFALNPPGNKCLGTSSKRPLRKEGLRPSGPTCTGAGRIVFYKLA